MNRQINLQTVLAQRPLGLAFDIDGTLSPIAPKPHEARLYPGIAPLLERARKRVHIAIMTGRDIDDGAPIVNVDGITYIGTHGLEWSDGLPSLHPVQIVPEALVYIEPGKRLLDLAEHLFAGVPGIIVQRKRIGGTIHYRLCPNPEQAREMILSLLEEPTRQAGMRLTEGKRIVEIRAPIAVNKGEALRQFVHKFDLHGVIFAGDDRTDLDAIKEVSQLRKEGITALSIVVRHVDTWPILLENADIVVQGMEGMARFLHEIVEQL